MIKPTKTIVMWGGLSGAAVLYGVALAEPGSLSRTASVILGLAGLGCSAIAWHAQDRDATRNPEVMNAHFITGGKLSAVDGDPDEIEILRGVFYRAGGRPRGNRLR